MEQVFAVAVAKAFSLTIFHPMRFLSPVRFIVSLVFLSLGLFADNVQPEIIRKARAYVGDSAKLDSLKSIHFQGTLTSDDGKTFALEIIFQKPLQQRITATGTDTIETTVLDGYDAWQRFEDMKDASRWRVNLLPADQIKRLRANTFDYLNLFKVYPQFGSIEDLGLVTLDGREVHKVAFRHGAGISFYRFFDSATGRLVRTETEQGGSMVEQGEIMVDGLRFPKKVINSSKGADGKLHAMVIEYEKITLNETFAASLFAVPSLSPTPSKR
jgi:outer membrane lipoprotein-sorting protein